MIHQDSRLQVVALMGGLGTRMNMGKGQKVRALVNDSTVVDRVKKSCMTVTQRRIVAVVNEYSASAVFKSFGSDAIYTVQPQPLGCPHAVLSAGNVVNSTHFLVHLGDQVYSEPLREFVRNFDESDEAVRIWTKYSRNAKNHTCALPKGDGTFIFREKPAVDDGFVVTGLYLFRNDHTFNVKPYLERAVSAAMLDQRESNFAEVLTMIQEDNFRIGHKHMNGEWFDVGTPEQLEQADRVFRGIEQR